MTNLNALSALFAGKTITLSGRGRTPAGGTAYTEAEIKAARTIARLVLTLMNTTCSEPFTEADIVNNQPLLETFQLANQQSNQFNDVAHAIRATYRLYEGYMLADDSTLQDFPKVDGQGQRAKRDQSSVNVLFRKAIKGLVTDEIRDQIFKLHIPSKTKEA